MSVVDSATQSANAAAFCLDDGGKSVEEGLAYLALVGIQTNVFTGKPNLSACLPHNGLIVYLGSGGDLSKDHDKSCPTTAISACNNNANHIICKVDTKTRVFLLVNELTGRRCKCQSL